MNVVKAIQKISWTAAGGMMHLLHYSQEEIHKAFEKVGKDFCVIFGGIYFTSFRRIDFPH